MRNRSLLVATLGLLVAGCATTPPTEVRETLDERTGVTVTSMPVALEFYSPQPERGLQAASFAYLAPLEVNRMGKRDTYLWLSVVRGADEGSDSAAGRLAPPDVSIAMDGERLEPAFVSADARELGMGQPVYERPAEWVGEAYYAITPQQVAQMAGANVLALELRTAGEEARRYDLSTVELAGLRNFSERIGNEVP
ncbi:MAG TPA: hypothetical protein VJ764_02160 [Steroidobacteraceae bacterium]|nr:hypothetical protein [Steroidobacteraceae bacterium]